MKPKRERPVGASCSASARRSRDDGREVAPGFPSLATVRKEVRGVAVCAPAHIVDGMVRNARIAKLKANQCSDVAMGFRTASPNHRAAIRSMLHFARDFLADLKRIDADVGTDRDDEIGRVV